MNINIGIDIDATINDARKYEYEQVLKLCNQNHIDFNYDETKIKITDAFGLPPDLANEVNNRLFKSVVKQCPTKQFAPEVIRGLCNKGNKIFIITARDPDYIGNPLYNCEDVITDTYQWFSNNKIPYHDIIFKCHGIKDRICKENKIDVMIDDDPENIIKVSKSGIPVIIMGESYNKYLYGYPNTKYAHNWIDVMNYLSV